MHLPKLAADKNAPAPGMPGNMPSSRANHLEAIARATVPMRRSHAPYHVKLFGANTFFLGVEQFVTQVNPFYQTDHDTVITNLQSSPFLAFQARRRLSNAGRLDYGRFASVEAGVVELVFTIWQ
jgi:hypothetical protein